MSQSLDKLVHTFAALAELGEEISESNDLDVMARTSLQLVQGSLAVMRGALLEFEPASSCLRFVVIRSIGSELSEEYVLRPEEVDQLVKGGIRVLSISGNERKRVEFLERNGSRLSEMRVDVMIPLLVRSNLLGALFLGTKASGEPYSKDDCELLCAMARHVAVGLQEHRHMQELERSAIENRRLYEGMRAIYRDTVKAFAVAIDCKDKYTQGHSERVGRYSEVIARELGWSEDEIEGISIAGYLHDIGKLVVERDIINAPYKIDAKQSSELNKHPAAGFEILSPIRHPYADIPLMARHHHERPDGRGYPDGLTDDQIPLGVKIVSLADSFDAMTTDRPYRRRRPITEVIEDLKRNTGKQFAAVAVVALCRALLKEINGETTERKLVKLLGRDYLEGTKAIPLLQALIAEVGTSTH
jgi:hypothetical protein